MNRLTIGSIVTATLLLVGCGSDGNSSSSKSSLIDSSTPATSGVENPVVAQKIGKGYYVDSAIEGVTYLCGSESGITDENGTFNFEIGSDCNFTIGGVNLRDINASLLEDNITVLEINETVAQLLQTLDSDGDASNGIQIPKSAESVVKETLPSLSDLNQDLLEAVHSRLTEEHSEEYNGTVVDKNQTVAHLNATKASLKERQIRTNLDVEAEHKNRRENNATSHEDDSIMDNIERDSHREEGRMDSNGTKAEREPNHREETQVEANANASDMGNRMGREEHTNANRDENISPHDAVADSFGDMAGDKGDRDSNREEHGNGNLSLDVEGTKGDRDSNREEHTNDRMPLDIEGAKGDRDSSREEHTTSDMNETIASSTIDTEDKEDIKEEHLTGMDTHSDSSMLTVDSNSDMGSHNSSNNEEEADKGEKGDKDNSSDNREEGHSGRTSGSSESRSDSSVIENMGGFGRRK